MRDRPLLAARALQAFFHVDPFDLGPDRGEDESDADYDSRWSEFASRQDEALLGALFINELVSNSRGLVQKPMVIQFIAPGGPKVEPYKVGDDASTLPADRTGLPDNHEHKPAG